MKQLNRLLKIWLITMVITASCWTVMGQTTVGPFTFYPTNIGGTMQGQAQINGIPAQAGDMIAAFDPTDDCVGAAELTIFGGLAYINFVIYGDDGGGHGMSAGEDFFIKLYDASEDLIIEYGIPLSGWQNTNFTPMPGYNNPTQIYNFIGCENATAVAGPDIDICEGVIPVVLSGSAENYASVLWTSDGDGTFEDATSPQTNYYPGFSDIQSGGAQLCLSAEGLPPCSSAEDCLTIDIQKLPLADVGIDATINESETFQLNGVAEDYSSILWSTNGDGTFVENTALSTVYTPGNNDKTTGEVELCLEAAALYPCTVSSISCLTLTILEEATLPVVSTSELTVITKNSAVSGGDVSSDGGAAVSARGVCWNSSGNPNLSDSHTSDGIGLGSFTSNIDGLSCDETYYVRAYATNSVGTAYGEELEFTTLPCGEQWFEPVWETPFQAMSIFVTKATIDDLNMVAGHEIGVYDIDPVSGDEICVGAGVLTEELTGDAFLEIIASMDDGLGDANGFQQGNEMIFKLYNPDPEIGEVDKVSVTFPYPGYDEVFNPLGTTVVELEGITEITQILNMVAGWNLVSTRAVPDNPDMLDIFDPLIQSGLLQKILDQDGNSVVHLPFPPPNGQWNNSIGDLINEQGYYVNVTENTSITITAPPVDMPFEIPLRAGWNIISMPCAENQSAQALLQEMIDNDKLVKVINDAGQSIVHLPFPPPSGQWNFGFDNFEPGEGYYVNVSEATSLTFDCDVSDFVNNYANIKTAKSDFFTPCYSNNPYMPMTAALSVTNLEPGDEVAVFDGEICVGTGKVGDDAFISFPLSADDPDTDIQDGFIAGNQLTCSVWDQSTNQVYEDVSVEFMEGDQLFTPLGTYAGEVNETLTGIGNHNSGDESWITISPNPSRDISIISYYIPQSGMVSMNLLEMNGRHVAELLNQNIQRGTNSLQFNTREYQKGSYLLIFTYENEQPEKTAIKVLIY